MHNSPLRIVIAISALFTTALGCAPAQDEASSASAISASGTAITSGYAGMCLNDLSDVTTDGNPLDIATCNGTAAQSWTYVDGTFVGPGGKCMSVAGDDQVAGAVVHLFTCNGTDAEQWKIVGTSIVSDKGLCLDVKDDSSANHTPLQLATCKAGYDAQVWNVDVTDVPTPALNAGYTLRTFNSTTLGSKAGAWYPYNFYYSKAAAEASQQNPDGSLGLTGRNDCGYNADVATAHQTSDAANDRWSGMAFGGGAYFEATFSFPGEYKGGDGVGWPAWWSLDVESLSGGYASAIQWEGEPAGFTSGTEIDFFEALVKNDPLGYHSSTHSWYGLPAKPQPDKPQASALEGISPFSSLNTYGCLWIPATDTKQGSIQFFLNGDPVGKVIVWDKYDPKAPAPPVAGVSAMSMLDTRHLVPMLGVHNPNMPMTITSVKVWQASAAHNLVH